MNTIEKLFGDFLVDIKLLKLFQKFIYFKENTS